MPERARIHSLLPVLCLLSYGCSCGSTDIGGDTGIDFRRDTTVEDPSFDPPIENLGDPGWRDSTEPWCVSGEMARNGWDLWSDERGVFVIIDLYDPSGGSGPLWAEHTIYFNGGAGWGPYLSGPSSDHETCVNELTGVPGET